MSFEDRLRRGHAQPAVQAINNTAMNKVQTAADCMHGNHRGVVPVSKPSTAAPALNQDPMAGNRRGQSTSTRTHPLATTGARTTTAATSVHWASRYAPSQQSPSELCNHTTLPLPSASHDTGLHVDPTHSQHRAKPAHPKSGLELPGLHSDPVYGHHIARVPQRAPPHVHIDDATGLVLPSHNFENTSKADTFHMRRSEHKPARGVSVFGEQALPHKGLHVDPMDQAHRKSVIGVGHRSDAVRHVSLHPNMSAVQENLMGINNQTSVYLSTENRLAGLHKDVMHNNHRVYKEQNWRSHFKFG